MERLGQSFIEQTCKNVSADENGLIAVLADGLENGYVVKLIDNGVETEVWVQTSSAPIDVTIHKFPENEEPIIVDSSDRDIYTETVSRYIKYILNPPRRVF